MNSKTMGNQTSAELREEIQMLEGRIVELETQNRELGLRLRNAQEHIEELESDCVSQFVALERIRDIADEAI